MIEFVGLEGSRSSLSGFRFAKIEGRIYILYEYLSEYLETKICDFTPVISANFIR